MNKSEKEFNVEIDINEEIVETFSEEATFNLLLRVINSKNDVSKISDRKRFIRENYNSIFGILSKKPRKLNISTLFVIKQEGNKVEALLDNS